MIQKAVFLDRDGVLNEPVIRDGLPYTPESVKTFHLLPGVSEAIKNLKSAGFKLIVVTNQPDVSRGKQSQESVDEMNLKLQRLLPELDEVKACFHSDEHHCLCRKPKPGMLLEAAEKWQIDLKNSFMVGDRWRDVDAGRAAGCKTIFVDHGYNEKRPVNPDAIVKSLFEATQYILAQKK